MLQGHWLDVLQQVWWELLPILYTAHIGEPNEGEDCNEVQNQQDGIEELSRTL